MSQSVTVTINAGGIGFASLLLTIFFVGLKLANTISWSWWWILSPLIASAGLYLVAMVAFIIFALLIMKDD